MPNPIREPATSDVYVLSAQSGKPIGMAIFIGGTKIITCAHVIADALGDIKSAYNDAIPDEKISFRFFRTNNVIVSGTVEEWFPVLDNKKAATFDDAGGLSDIAIIELDSHIDESIAVPAIFTDVPPNRSSHCLRFYGNTKSRPNGGWISAKENGPVEKERLELRTEGGDDNNVEGGFSGSLVWDQYHGRCVGMIDARLGDHRAYMIPTLILYEACIDLILQAPENSSRGSQIEHAMMYIDRIKERKNMEKLLRDVREQKPQTPSICVISGHSNAHPDLLVKTFINSTFRTELRADQKYVQSKNIEIPVGYEALDDVIENFTQELGLTGINDPATIAEQLRIRKETLVLSSKVYLEDFDEDLEETLEGYVKFLSDISSSQPDVLFFHFFILTTSRSGMTEADFNTALNSLVEKCKNCDIPKDVVHFGPLRRLGRQHVERWAVKELKDVLSQSGKFNETFLLANIQEGLPEEFEMNECILYFSNPENQSNWL